jgi:alpha-beta hydrolase superfamily lysophospholipase
LTTNVSRRWRSSLSVLGTAILIAACSGDGASTDSRAIEGLPGQLLGEPLDFVGYPPTADVSKAVRIRYQSTSGRDGSPTQITALVLAPRGNPPPGGWPIASIAHATSGVTSECAPSMYPDLIGGLGPAMLFVKSGFVVAMTDYEGLGSAGPHPYLDARTAGDNVIDAVRAARKVIPKTSDRWVAFGVSQGGQAAWAANERSESYGAGLKLIGSVSVSPAADLTRLVDRLDAGTLTREQMMLMPMVVWGLKVAYPDVNVYDYLRGPMARQRNVFLACAGEMDGRKLQIVDSSTPADVKPSTPEAADKLRRWLAQNALPQERAPSPMLVIYGDADPVVPAAWTDAAVRAGCAKGDIIEVHVVRGGGHGDLEEGPRIAEWLFARLADDPPPNSCR